jgi:hypothetical protein
MIAFLLWFILFVLCPPIAILAILIYSVFWVLMLPIKLASTAVEAVLQTLKAVLLAPVRLVSRRT